MSDASRKPGRPKGSEPGSSVSTWLKTSEHDRLAQQAKQREISVSALVRTILVLQLKS